MPTENVIRDITVCPIPVCVLDKDAKGERGRLSRLELCPFGPWERSVNRRLNMALFISDMETVV